jgi:polyphosphate kinase
MLEDPIDDFAHPAERAKALAIGLHTYGPPENLPQPLWEAAYLLTQCQGEERPALEQLRILGLAATSLDQFSVDQLPHWLPGARTDQEVARVLAKIALSVDEILQAATDLLQDHLLPRLSREHGVDVLTPQQLDSEARHWLNTLFSERVYPLLTPLAIDPGHPFPFISSFSLNLLVSLRHSSLDGQRSISTYARVKVPRLLPRFIRIPHQESERRIYIQSEELVRFYLPELFPGLTVESAHLFRVLRAAESETQHELSDDLRVRQRQMNLPVVRLDIGRAMPPHISTWLIERLQAPSYACYHSSKPIGQLHLVELANRIENVTETVDLYKI